MRLAIALLVVAGTAHAGTVTPPTGWKTDPAAAVSLSHQLGDVAHFGDKRSVVTTEVFRAPGASLFVTRKSAAIAGLDKAARDRAASHELNDVMVHKHQQPGLEVVARQVENLVVANPPGFDGRIRWRDTSTGIVTESRVIVVADVQHVVAVIGECVLAADVAKEIDTACVGALATLDVGVVIPSRVALELVKTPGPELVKAPTPAAPAGSASSGPSLVESGPRPSLPPMEIPQDKREPDRRPIYVGLGLIVLAVIFYWNRKNREKLEREYEQRTADKPEDKPAGRMPADRDADDLHAAAEDPADKDPNNDTKVDKA